MGNPSITKHNRWSLAPLFFRFLIISTVIWLTLLVVTLGVTLRFSHSVMQEKLENELTSTAVTLGNSEIIRGAMNAKQPAIPVGNTPIYVAAKTIIASIANIFQGRLKSL